MSTPIVPISEQPDALESPDSDPPRSSARASHHRDDGIHGGDVPTPSKDDRSGARGDHGGTAGDERPEAEREWRALDTYVGRRWHTDEYQRILDGGGWA